MLCNEWGFGEHCSRWHVQFDWSVEGELIGKDLPESLERPSRRRP